VGRRLEKAVETASFGYHTFCLCWIFTLADAVIVNTVTYPFHPDVFVHYPVDFSVAVLSLIVIDCGFSYADERSFFWLISFPSWLYPCIVLGLFALIMPFGFIVMRICGLPNCTYWIFVRASHPLIFQSRYAAFSGFRHQLLCSLSGFPC
jgi:hypothetical protein